MRISERVDNAVRAMAELAASDGTEHKAEAIADESGHLPQVSARHPPRPEAGLARPFEAGPGRRIRPRSAGDRDLARRHLPGGRRPARRRARRERARPGISPARGITARGVDGRAGQPAQRARNGEHRRSGRPRSPSRRDRTRRRLPRDDRNNGIEGSGTASSASGLNRDRGKRPIPVFSVGLVDNGSGSSDSLDLRQEHHVPITANTTRDTNGSVANGCTARAG